jgi:hypothetical protein
MSSFASVFGLGRCPSARSLSRSCNTDTANSNSTTSNNPSRSLALAALSYTSDTISLNPFECTKSIHRTDNRLAFVSRAIFFNRSSKSSSSFSSSRRLPSPPSVDVDAEAPFDATGGHAPRHVPRGTPRARVPRTSRLGSDRVIIGVVVGDADDRFVERVADDDDDPSTRASETVIARARVVA